MTAPDYGHRRDAVEMMLDWAGNPHERPFAALLGEPHMGKTTNLRAFAAALLRMREAGEAAPLPIYLPFHRVADLIRHGQTTEDIYDIVLRDKGAKEYDVTTDDVLRQVRSNGAIAILDGVDSVLARTPPSQAEAVMRAILGILPTALVCRPEGAKKADIVGVPGKLLVGMRSNWFRTAHDETHFLPRAAGTSASEWATWRLMPLKREQSLHTVGLALGMAPSGVEVDPDALGPISRPVPR